jgi:hypothetical protein
MTYSFGRKKEKNGIRTDWKVRRFWPRWLCCDSVGVALAIGVTGVVMAMLSRSAGSVPGVPASMPTSNNVLLLNRAINELWSLRFMVNVLLWVTGVVGNYNTTFFHVNTCPSLQYPTKGRVPNRLVR